MLEAKVKGKRGRLAVRARRFGAALLAGAIMTVCPPGYARADGMEVDYVGGGTAQIEKKVERKETLNDVVLRLRDTSELLSYLSKKYADTTKDEMKKMGKAFAKLVDRWGTKESLIREINNLGISEHDKEYIKGELDKIGSFENLKEDARDRDGWLYTFDRSGDALQGVIALSYATAIVDAEKAVSHVDYVEEAIYLPDITFGVILKSNVDIMAARLQGIYKSILQSSAQSVERASQNNKIAFLPEESFRTVLFPYYDFMHRVLENADRDFERYIEAESLPAAKANAFDPKRDVTVERDNEIYFDYSKLKNMKLDELKVWLGDHVSKEQLQEIANMELTKAKGEIDKLSASQGGKLTDMQANTLFAYVSLIDSTRKAIKAAIKNPPSGLVVPAADVNFIINPDGKCRFAIGATIHYLYQHKGDMKSGSDTIGRDITTTLYTQMDYDFSQKSVIMLRAGVSKDNMENFDPKSLSAHLSGKGEFRVHTNIALVPELNLQYSHITPLVARGAFGVKGYMLSDKLWIGGGPYGSMRLLNVSGMFGEGTSDLFRELAGEGISNRIWEAGGYVTVGGRPSTNTVIEGYAEGGALIYYGPTPKFRTGVNLMYDTKYGRFGVGVFYERTGGTTGPKVE